MTECAKDCCEQYEKDVALLAGIKPNKLNALKAQVGRYWKFAEKI